MRKKAALASILAGAALLPLFARADVDKPGFGPMRGPGGPRLFLVLRMVDALGLSDEKALAVGRILKQGDEKRAELRGKRKDLEKQIRDALAKPKPDSAVLTTLVDQAVELHKQQEQIAEDSFTAMKKVLTVEEQAKLVLLRSRLRREFGLRSSEHADHDGHWRRSDHRSPGHEHGAAGEDGSREGPDHGRSAPAPDDGEG